MPHNLRKKLLSLKKRHFYFFIAPIVVFSAFFNGVAVIAQDSQEAPKIQVNNQQASDQQTNKQQPLSVSLNEDGVKLVKKRDFISAEKLFLRALDADKGNLTAVFNLAGVYLQNKNDSGAINLLKQYAKPEQKDAGIFARLGDAYFVNKEIKEAKGAYEKALSLNTNYPGASSRLGTIYSLLNDTESAEVMLDRAASLDPKNPTILSNLASVLYANKKYDEAIKAAKRSTSINPSKEAYITLGNIYLAKGNQKDALTAFKRAKDLGENSKNIEEVIKELEE